jgi:hypothetical protein
MVSAEIIDESRGPLGQLHRAVFASGLTQAGLAAAHGVLVICFAVSRRYLDTEGLFLNNIGVTLVDGYWKILFSLKAKPPLLLLYAPFSAIGFDAFLIAHATLGAAGIWLIAEAARRCRLPNPNLAGWLMAMSLGYSVAASNGLANSDGAVFSALFLCLYASRHHTAAALTLGLLPFVRHELAVLSVAFLVWDVWTHRRWRFPVTACAIPLAYILAGAIVFGDLLWPYTYFPNPTGMPGDIRGFDPPSATVVGKFFLESLAVNFGVLGLFAPFACRHADRHLFLLFVVTGATLVALTAMQYTGAGFDLSLRYHVTLIPLVAILATHAFSSLGRRSLVSRTRVALAQLLVFAVALLFSGHQMLSNDYSRLEHAQNHRLMGALKDSGIYRGQPIFTDQSIARYDGCAGVTAAAFLANASIRWYMDRLSPPGTAWFGELEAAFRRRGFLIDAENHAVRTDAIYLLKDGERMRSWRDRIEAWHPTAVPLVDDFRAFYWDSRR